MTPIRSAQTSVAGRLGDPLFDYLPEPLLTLVIPALVLGGIAVGLVALGAPREVAFGLIGAFLGARFSRWLRLRKRDRA